jgi:hypothetical protein
VGAAKGAFWPLRAPSAMRGDHANPMHRREARELAECRRRGSERPPHSVRLQQLTPNEAPPLATPQKGTEGTMCFRLAQGWVLAWGCMGWHVCTVGEARRPGGPGASLGCLGTLCSIADLKGTKEACPDQVGGTGRQPRRGVLRRRRRRRAGGGGGGGGRAAAAAGGRGRRWG